MMQIRWALAGAAAVAMAYASSASAAVIVKDFTALGELGNVGTSYDAGDGLIVTARTGVASPGNGINGGSPGTIFIGDLGGLDDGIDCPDAMMSGGCFGLGVQTNNYDAMMGSYEGSLGISGEGGHANESVVLDWAADNVIAQSLKVTLVGLNGPDAMGMGGDELHITYDIEDGADGVDITVNISGILNDPSVLDFSEILPAGARLGTIAILAESGHFGIGGIEWETVSVSEPAALALIGTGLLGVWAAGRRRRL